MTVAIKESGPRTAPVGRLFDAGAESLDAAVAATLKTLAVRGNARCLACGKTLVRTDEGHGRCTTCASTLE